MCATGRFDAASPTDQVTPELDPAALQSFLEALDTAGDGLREVLEGAESEGTQEIVLDEDSLEENPALQFYLDGAAFLEAGYLMIEDLSLEYPAVFRALYDHHYGPLFHRVRRGQIGWGEALNGLPEFLRDVAAERVQAGLLAEDDGPTA